MRRFGRAIVGNSLRSNSPLENDQMFKVAPSIFATVVQQFIFTQ